MTAILSDQEVQQLIQVVEGGVKETSGRWYTLGIPINHHYSLDEQLESIRVLGTSGNPRAYEYLKKLPVTKFISFAPVGWDGQTFDDTDYGGKTVYVNAKGRLKQVVEAGVGNEVIRDALLPFLKRLEEKGDYEEAAKVYPLIGMKEKSDELFSKLINDLERRCLLEEGVRIAGEAGFWDRRKAIRLKQCEIAESEGRFLDAERYLHEEGGEVGYGERRKELLEKAINAYKNQDMHLEAADIANRLLVMGDKKYNHDRVKEMYLRAIDECEKQGLFDKIANIHTGFSDVEVRVVDTLEKQGFHKEAAVAATRALIYVKNGGFRDRTINLHLRVIGELERSNHLEEAAQFVENAAFNYSLRELYTTAANIYQKLGLSAKAEQLIGYVK